MSIRQVEELQCFARRGTLAGCWPCEMIGSQAPRKLCWLRKLLLASGGGSRAQGRIPLSPPRLDSYGVSL